MVTGEEQNIRVNSGRSTIVALPINHLCSEWKRRPEISNVDCLVPGNDNDINSSNLGCSLVHWSANWMKLIRQFYVKTKREENNCSDWALLSCIHCGFCGLTFTCHWFLVLMSFAFGFAGYPRRLTIDFSLVRAAKKNSALLRGIFLHHLWIEFL